MLLECVLGALGLAIERAAFGSPADVQVEPLQQKVNRWKKTLQLRLESLVKLRRHIDAVKNLLETQSPSERKNRLQAKLARREKRYHTGIRKLRHGHRKLARLERELRLENREAQFAK